MSQLFSYYPQLPLLRDMLSGSGRRVFLVGGALRDFFLNHRGFDLDFAVDKNAVALSRKLARRLKGAFVLLDEEHGTGRIVQKKDNHTWTFDFTDWRGKGIRQDLALRDFTINAMALDLSGPLEESFIIEVKGARQDLKKGIVRMVVPKAFRDDPLRLLRAFSLRAVFGLKIEARTLAQIKKDAHLISPVSVERIREELFKILASRRAAETLSAMDKIGLLPKVVPQLTVMYGVAQGGFHHLDVWRHSLEVLARLEAWAEENRDARVYNYLHETIGGAHTRLSLLKMAALLHDIGKPETRRKQEGRTTFHGHEHVGQGITRQVAKQLKLSVKERYFLEDAVAMHLRPGYLSNFKRPSEKAVFRFMRDAKTEAASLAILALADQAATRGPLTTKAKARHHAKVCQMLIERHFTVGAQKPKERLLTGDDLIRSLKIKPSPLFGRILSSVEEAAALGKISTKKEALALAKKISKQSVSLLNN